MDFLSAKPVDTLFATLMHSAILPRKTRGKSDDTGHPCLGRQVPSPSEVPARRMLSMNPTKAARSFDKVKIDGPRNPKDQCFPSQLLIDLGDALHVGGAREIQKKCI
jgi:hypothetical protein